MCVRAMGCVEKEPVFIAVTEAVKWREERGSLDGSNSKAGLTEYVGLVPFSSFRFCPSNYYHTHFGLFLFYYVCIWQIPAWNGSPTLLFLPNFITFLSFFFFNL